VREYVSVVIDDEVVYLLLDPAHTELIDLILLFNLDLDWLGLNLNQGSFLVAKQTSLERGKRVIEAFLGIDCQLILKHLFVYISDSSYLLNVDLYLVFEIF
jgi:hypothetical protein